MKNRWVKWVLVFAGAFVLAVEPVTDRDLGWHLATGQYVLREHQVPLKDLFSFTLPDHEFVAHSWLSEVGLASVFGEWGLWGVSFLYAGVYGMVMVLLILTAQKWFPKDMWSPTLVLMVPLATAFLGQRTQAVTLLGLVLIQWWFMRGGKALRPSGSPRAARDAQDDKAALGSLEALSKKEVKLDVKEVVGFGLVFLVWSNLHAGFSLGLAFYGLLLVAESVSLSYGQGRLVLPPGLGRHLVNIMVGTLATLVNPYGIGLWRHIYAMVTNSTAAALNSDWLPLLSAHLPQESLGLRLALVLLVVAVLVMPSLKLENKLMVGLFGAASFSSLRYVLPLMVVMLPLLPGLIDYLVSGKVGERLKRYEYLVVPAVLLAGIVVAVPRWQSTAKAYETDEAYAEYAGYPYKAVAMIKERDLPVNILNHYNWGGYVIWQLPEHKVFIDGRMDNFLVEGKSFLSEFARIQRMEGGWEEKLDEYGVETVLLPPDWQLVDELKGSDGWVLVYEDEAASVLVREDAL